MLIEKLNMYEKDAIDDYISMCAEGDGITIGHRGINNRKSIEDILTPWENAKSKYLYNLMGGNFILKKAISYKKSKNQLVKEFDKESFDSPIQVFYRNFSNMLRTNEELCDIKYELLDMFSSYMLADGKYDSNDFEIILKGQDKPFKVHRGMKITKILSKIASVYNVEGYEEFRIRHSQVLNQKDMHGTLCLSIHPLDYMTMSDNYSGWSSCMSWMEVGAYRSGTVEMMNSENVIIAYLESDDEKLAINSRYKWNNKKWRELFIVTDELITEVKGYPYQSDELATTVIEWIRSLARENLGWSYSDDIIKHKGDEDIIYLDDEQNEGVRFNFVVKNMYNDFGSKNHHLANLGSIKKSLRTPSTYHPSVMKKNLIYDIDIEYSGMCECMYCGKDMDYDASDITSRLVCASCGESAYCHCCDNPVNEEELTWVEDGTVAVCPYCLDEYYSYDRIANDYYRNEDCIEIYLAKEDNKPNESNLCISLYNGNNEATEILEYYLSDGAKVKQYEQANFWGKRWLYYINLADLTSKAASYFNLWRNNFERYYKDREDLTELVEKIFSSPSQINSYILNISI